MPDARKIPGIILVEKRKVKMLGIVADEQVGFLKHWPKAGEIFLKKRIISIRFIFVNADD
jgi:hypothetical protein